MSCCDPMYLEEHSEELRAGKCPACGGVVDSDGKSCESDNCWYSPVMCSTCDWRPCDLSC